MGLGSGKTNSLTCGIDVTGHPFMTFTQRGSGSGGRMWTSTQKL